jgi:hypothetical protein
VTEGWILELGGRFDLAPFPLNARVANRRLAEAVIFTLPECDVETRPYAATRRSFSCMAAEVRMTVVQNGKTY